MNVKVIHVKTVELVWMKSMDISVNVCQDGPEIIVKQVRLLSLKLTTNISCIFVNPELHL